jgi:hypothetical protein
VIRKRSDNVKPGRGIDGTEGENYTKQHRVSPWDHVPTSDEISPIHGRYTDNESGLRNKAAGAGTGGDGAGLQGSHDIFDEVEAQNSDGGNRVVKSRGQP